MTHARDGFDGKKTLKLATDFENVTVVVDSNGFFSSSRISTGPLAAGSAQKMHSENETFHFGIAFAFVQVESEA